VIDAAIKPSFINPRDICYVKAFMQLFFHVLPLKLLIVAWPNRDRIISALHLMFVAMSQDRLIDAVSLSLYVSQMSLMAKIASNWLADIRGAQ
jgi:hypothetical protein